MLGRGLFIGGSGEIRTRDQRIKSHMFNLFSIVHANSHSHLSQYLKGFNANQVFMGIHANSCKCMYLVTQMLPKGEISHAE